MQQQQQLVLAVAIGLLEYPLEGGAHCFHFDTAQLGDVVAAVALAHQHQQLLLAYGEGIEAGQRLYVGIERMLGIAQYHFHVTLEAAEAAHQGALDQQRPEIGLTGNGHIGAGTWQQIGKAIQGLLELALLLLILQRENTIDGPQFDVFIGDAVERHIGIMNMPLVIYDGAGFIMVFHQLLQLIVLGFQGQQVPIMLAPGGQTRIDLCQRGEIPAAEVILGGAAVTAQCGDCSPPQAARLPTS